MISLTDNTRIEVTKGHIENYKSKRQYKDWSNGNGPIENGKSNRQQKDWSYQGAYWKWYLIFLFTFDACNNATIILLL